MALVLKDRVKETTTTTGTGTVTLAGAAAGFDSFSVIGDGNTTYYAIVAQTPGEWEVGIGTYASSGTTLARTTVLASSNSGSLVNFSAGTKDVFVTYPAGTAVVASDNPGTAGQLLTSNGSGVAPSWENAPASLLGDTDSASPYETSLGYQAGDVNTGTYNTFIGYQTGRVNTTGGQCTAVGSLALYANTTGTSNCAVGYAALFSNTTATANTAVGSSALSDNTTGQNSVAVGTSALIFNTTGSDNTAIGSAALFNNTSGANNVAVGRIALTGNTTGGNNCAVGYSALDDNTTGTNNTALGYLAGISATTGSNLTMIGYTAAPSSPTATNEVTLGNTSVARFRVPGCGIDNTSAALSGTTPSVDAGARDTYTLTTSGNTTFTFTGAPSSGQVGSFSLIITAGGTHTLTWPASVDWQAGTPPAAPASGETDVYTFMTINGGTTWYGFLAGDAMS